MDAKLGIAVIIMGLAMSASSASAHHAFAAEFDANKPVTFKGTITKMEWVNPDAWLHVDEKQPRRHGRELGRRSGLGSKRGFA